jgi:hypothetical protein
MSPVRFAAAPLSASTNRSVRIPALDASYADRSAVEAVRIVTPSTISARPGTIDRSPAAPE